MGLAFAPLAQRKTPQMQSDIKKPRNELKKTSPSQNEVGDRLHNGDHLFILHCIVVCARDLGIFITICFYTNGQ